MHLCAELSRALSVRRQCEVLFNLSRNLSHNEGWANRLCDKPSEVFIIGYHWDHENHKPSEKSNNLLHFHVSFITFHWIKRWKRIQVTRSISSTSVICFWGNFVYCKPGRSCKVETPAARRLDTGLSRILLATWVSSNQWPEHEASFVKATLA